MNLSSTREQSHEVSSRSIQQKKDHRSSTYRYGNTCISILWAPRYRVAKLWRLTTPERLLIPWSNYAHFRWTHRDLSFKPMITTLSFTVTKFRHNHPGAQKFSGESNWGLREDVFQIWSNCNEKWLFHKHFCDFGLPGSMGSWHDSDLGFDLQSNEVSSRPMKQKKHHQSIPYHYGDTRTSNAGAILKCSKTLKAHNSLTAADTLVKLYTFSVDSLRSFIWAYSRRSIASRYKVPSLLPRGPKRFRGR